MPRRPRRLPGTRRAAPAAARVVSATTAAKTFGQLVDRVRETRATYVVERGGKPVARISPASEATCTVADLIDLLRSREPLDGAYLDDVAHGQELWNQPAVPDDRWGR